MNKVTNQQVEKKPSKKVEEYKKENITQMVNKFLNKNYNKKMMKGLKESKQEQEPEQEPPEEEPGTETDQKEYSLFDIIISFTLIFLCLHGLIGSSWCQLAKFRAVTKQKSNTVHVHY